MTRISDVVMEIPRRVIAAYLPLITPGQIDFADTRLNPQVIGGVNWGMRWEGQMYPFASLNEALQFLDQQQGYTTNAGLEYFEELRRRYLSIKAQKEFGGSLLAKYALGSNIIKHYEGNKDMFDKTKEFWAEANRDRNKVTRSVDGIRRLVHNHRQATQEYFDHYILDSMNTSYLDTRLIKTDMNYARSSGLIIR